jgi:hypothetical protein
VDVNRLVAVKAIKEEPIGSGDVLDSWHSNGAVSLINSAANFRLLMVLNSSRLTTCSAARFLRRSEAPGYAVVRLLVVAVELAIRYRRGSSVSGSYTLFLP